MSAFVGIYLT